MELNGERWFVPVTDTSVISTSKREKASSDQPGSVGAPMPGVVVDVKVKAGDAIRVRCEYCYPPSLEYKAILLMRPEPCPPLPMPGVVVDGMLKAGDAIR
jgi:pyruvate carboxylase